MCDCLIVLLREFMNFLDSQLNSPARVDTFRYQNHISIIDQILTLLGQNDSCLYDCDCVIVWFLYMHRLIPRIEETLLDTNIMSPAFTDLILAVLCQNCTCLCDFVIA